MNNIKQLKRGELIRFISSSIESFFAITSRYEVLDRETMTRMSNSELRALATELCGIIRDVKDDV